MFGRKLKFLFLSLICFLNFSCSFSVMNPGNINYNLPSSREAGNGETITYRVTLQNMGGRIFYDKFLTDTQIKINNIPVGRYYIAIKGHDSKYNYFGDQHFTVEHGKEIPIDINLIKTPINTENGNGDGGNIPVPTPPLPEESILQSIEIKLNDNAYVPYNSKIDIKNFTITEHYSKDKTVTVSADGYNNYSITPNTKITELKDVPVTITRNDNNEITKQSTIPCKFTLTKPTVSLNKTGPLELTQGQNSENTITAQLTYNPQMPDGSFNVQYEWLVKTNTNEYSSLLGQHSNSFTIPVSKAEEKTYKCKVTVTPKDQYKNFCTNTRVESSSKDITVTVKAAGGGDAPIPADAVTTFEQLKAKVTAQEYEKTIIIGGDIVMTEPLTITGNTIIKACKQVTLTRGDTNTGTLFTVGPNGAKLTLGDSSNKITLDGKNIVEADSLITVPEGSQFIANNCVLQNNKENKHGGGAIYNKQGTITLTNSTIQSNESTSNGGGIHVFKGKAFMTNVNFLNNKSGANGGAISITAGSQECYLDNTNANVTGNNATKSGGGIYLSGSSFSLKNGSINNNGDEKLNGNGRNLYINGSSTSPAVWGSASITTTKNIDAEVTSTTDITKY